MEYKEWKGGITSDIIPNQYPESHIGLWKDNVLVLGYDLLLGSGLKNEQGQWKFWSEQKPQILEYEMFPLGWLLGWKRRRLDAAGFASSLLLPSNEPSIEKTSSGVKQGLALLWQCKGPPYLFLFSFFMAEEDFGMGRCFDLLVGPCQ
jgi:hypothetical protein